MTQTLPAGAGHAARACGRAARRRARRAAPPLAPAMEEVRRGAPAICLTVEGTRSAALGG